MDETSYKYDVAFSFLKEDEGLALQINDLLCDRVSTFIYSQKQETIAGKDGEMAFNNVFGSEARVVVVLYRENWGKSTWTRIEETAIRNRAYEEGYDFVLFIPLDMPPTVPQWLPKTQLWIGLDRWEIEGAASVIDARVQQAGGVPHEETAVDHAQRLERQVNAEEKRQKFLLSEEGVKSAKNELKKLFSKIIKICEEISSANQAIKLKYDLKDKTFVITSHEYSLLLIWFLQYANTLEYSYLKIKLFKGVVSLHHDIYVEKPHLLKEQKFEFDRNAGSELGWKKSSEKRHFFSTKQLAEECLKIILSQIQENLKHFNVLSDN